MKNSYEIDINFVLKTENMKHALIIFGIFLN